jgi:HEAT repeat protein
MRLRFFAVLIFGIMTCFAQSSDDVKELLKELANPATTSNAASRLIKVAHAYTEPRKLINQQLPTMLLQTRDVPVVQSEAKVAGALRLESAIPSLIQLLSWFNYDGNTTLSGMSQLKYDPVARALYEIGGPADPALSEALESNDLETRRRVASILVLRNTPETKTILRKHLDKEPDSHLKNFIQLNLDK